MKIKERNQSDFFNLKVSKTKLDKKFREKQLENIKFFNPYLTILCFLISISDTTFQYTWHDEIILTKYTWALFLSLSMTITFLISLIIVIILKNNKFQQLINFSNYILISPPLYLTREILLKMQVIDRSVYFLFLLTEFFIRLLWLFTRSIIFIQAALMNLIILIMYFILTLSAIGDINIDLFNIQYIYLLLFFLAFSYFYTKEIKLSSQVEIRLNKKRSGSLV